LGKEAQKKKLGKKKSAEKDRKGLLAPYNPSPPFEKGGRKLSSKNGRGFSSAVLVIF